jgi:hypothetical protein
MLRVRVPQVGLVTSSVRLGLFDTELVAASWFDENLLTEGWYTDELIPAIIAAINNIRLGTNTPAKFYVGANQVSKIYIGTNLVYSSS